MLFQFLVEGAQESLSLFFWLFLWSCLWLFGHSLVKHAASINLGLLLHLANHAEGLYPCFSLMLGMVFFYFLAPFVSFFFLEHLVYSYFFILLFLIDFGNRLIKYTFVVEVKHVMFPKIDGVFGHQAGACSTAK